MCFAREELQSVQRELEVLSEQYSQKCLENAHLAQALEAERQALRQCQRENQELNAHNQVRVCAVPGAAVWAEGDRGTGDEQSGLCAEPWPCSPFPQWLSSSSQELNNRLAAEITRLRTLLTGEGGGEAAGSPLTQGKDAYELEVSSAALCSVGRHKGPPSSHPSLHALDLHGWPGTSAVLIFPSHHVKLDSHEAVGTSRNRGLCREHIGAGLGKVLQEAGDIFLAGTRRLMNWLA